jgi:hypothetical protein
VVRREPGGLLSPVFLCSDGKCGRDAPASAGLLPRVVSGQVARLKRLGRHKGFSVLSEYLGIRGLSDRSSILAFACYAC